MTWEVRVGESIELMGAMADSSIDSIVCDPPYGIGFMGHEWDQPGDFGPVLEPGGKRRRQPSAATGAGHERERALLGGPAGKRHTGDGGTSRAGGAMHAGRYDLSLSANGRFQAWCEAWAREALRVLKPGGHALVFGGTRTFHRMTCGLEDAGFEIRDCLMFLYGTGFPKSLNIGCRCGEATPEHDVRSMPDADLSTPLDAEAHRGEVLLAGVPQPSVSAGRAAPGGGDEGRGESGVEGRRDAAPPEGQLRAGALCESAYVGAADGSEGWVCDGAPARDGSVDRAAADTDGGRAPSGSLAAAQRASEPRTVADEPRSQASRGWPLCGRCGKPSAGLGTALKPAWEPVIVARKPLDGTVAATVLAHGTGALNVDGCRIATDERWEASGVQSDPSIALAGGADGSLNVSVSSTHDLGRWPANVVLDEAAGSMLDAQTGELAPGNHPANREGIGFTANGGGTNTGTTGERRPTEAGGASRFFYCAKTSSAERAAGLELERNVHPTVKPVELMRWLVRLVTPPGGLVLDPFVGSGSTGVACVLEGFSFLGLEREDQYVEIARARIAWWERHRGEGTTVEVLEAAQERHEREAFGQTSLL